MNARTDLSFLSEEAARKIRERKEWARRQCEQGEKRMAENNAKIEREKRAKEEVLEKMKREAAMVADMLQEMYRLNPEFAARREAALQDCIIHPFLQDTLSLCIPFSARQNERGQTCVIALNNQFPVALKGDTFIGYGWILLSVYLLEFVQSQCFPSFVM
jgi:hypothetical protein